VFIFPWAARLESYSVFGLVEMAIFIFILALGLFYAWRKRLLALDLGAGQRLDMGLVENGKLPKPLTALLNVSRKLLPLGVPVGPERGKSGRKKGRLLFI
jgi:hypothetical protein